MPLISAAQFPGLAPDPSRAGLGFSQGLQGSAQQQQTSALSQQSNIQANEARLNTAIQTAAQLSATPSVEGRIAFLKANPSEDNDELLGWMTTGNEAQANESIDAMVNVGQQMGVLQPTAAELAAAKAKPDAAAQVQSSEFLPGGGARIVRKDGTVEVVQPLPEEQEIIKAGEERGVDLQQRRAKGRGLGAGTAKLANNALDMTEKMRSNNLKLKKVIAEVRGGAETGPLANRLPSFRASTLRLMQIKNELGLDVVGSVTFGALSEGELQLAMDTALPTGLEGPELVKWANGKIAAQEKLAEYFEDQAIFLSKQGNTAADWLARGRAAGVQRGQEAQAPAVSAPAQQAPQVINFEDLP